MDEPVTQDDIRELVAAIARLQEQQRGVHENFLQTLKGIAASVKALQDRVEAVEEQMRQLASGERPTRQ